MRKWCKPLLVMIIVVFMPFLKDVYGATSSSYQLQGDINNDVSTFSNSYDSCARFGKLGVGSISNSYSYSIVPVVRCSKDAEFGGDGGGEPIGFICGNGVLQLGEQCDDGNLQNNDGCSSICQIEPDLGTGGDGRRRNICGNGILQIGEQCDDGNTNSGDGCSSACLIETPSGGGGGGTPTEPTEPEEPTELSGPTDPINPTDPVDPSETELPEEPSPSYCGNGIRETGEFCDDGNLINGDGCSAICQRERNLFKPDFPEQPQSSYEPVTSNESDIDESAVEEKFADLPLFPVVPSFPEFPAGITGQILSICGNALTEFGEQCDDGNTVSGDGCSNSCRVEFVPTLEQTQLGIDYITNDPSTLFYETFNEGSGEYDISVIDTNGNLIDLEVVETSPGYFSFQFEEEVSDGFYQVQVVDKQSPEQNELLILEVKRVEPIESPLLTSLDEQVLEEDDDLMNLITLEQRPVLRGETSLPATVAFYSQKYDESFIVYTNDENRFLFEYPYDFLPGDEDTLQVVAHYENGRVSEEQLIRISYPILRGAAPRLVSEFDPLFWAFITTMSLVSLVFALVAGKAVFGLSVTVRSHLLLMSFSRSLLMRFLQGIILFAVVIATIVFFAINVMAATTTPNLIPYEGILKDAGGTPITTAQSFRFSFWVDGDFSAGVDRDGVGSIPLAAPGFSGFSEVQIITPDVAGFFQLNIGSVSGTIPDFITTTHLFLQVEVKPSASPDTAYETLDIDGIDNSNDRQAVGTLPYSRNSDFIDNAELGTSEGDIVTLGAGDVFPTTFIPGGTDADDFIIDANGDAPGLTRLSFGDLLNDQILQFDPDGVAVGDGWFEFTDDVNIQGDLTVTGTINGVTLGPQNITTTLTPEYPNATVDGDESDNRGRMEVFFVDTDGPGSPENINYYRWTTQQAAMQDFDVIVRFRLPDGFTSFQATPLTLSYRTSDNNVLNNKIDVQVEDSIGALVPGMAGNTDLTSAGAFASSNITFGGGTFTAGSQITIRIKASALSGSFADIADLAISFISQ